MFFINKKKRLIVFFAVNISLLVCGAALVALATFVSGTPLSRLTDCPSHVFWGIYCPFCGGTRAIGSLLRGEIIHSLIYNPAILPGLIAFVVYDLLCFKAILKNERRILHIHRWVWICLLVLLLANAIVRNALLLVWDIDYIAAMSF